MNEYIVNSIDTLTDLYGPVGDASIKKEISYLHPHYQDFIKASPFLILASVGSDGLDASPRGDGAGFVHIADEKTLILPDRRGNNRLDSLKNIIQNPKIALLFLIPGLGECLRVNGTATISVDPELLQQFTVQHKPPQTVLIIQVETVFFQCSRAIRRANLWDTPHPEISVPTPGRILSDLTNSTIDGEKYDRELPERIKSTLY